MIAARWIVTAVIAIGAVFLVDSAVEEKKTLPVVEVVSEKDPLGQFGRSIRFIGICGVVSSLVWGASIIIVSHHRKGGAK